MTLHWTEAKFLPQDLQPLAPAKRRFYWEDLSAEVKDAVVDTFCKNLAPLHKAGKLGLVLFQLPPWLVGPYGAAEEHVLAMQAALRPYKLAVELRNKNWLEGVRMERTLGWLRQHELAFVAVDEPQGFRSSVPPIVDVTAPDAYLRFHGKNAETWETGGKTSADRFDWRYTPRELEEWVARIEFMAEQSERVHVLFNANRADQVPSTPFCVVGCWERA